MRSDPSAARDDKGASGTRRERAIASVLATAIGVGTAVHAFYYFPRVVDDLFISLRYAESLVHGRGLVFNAGERVEGFSSPLWVLLQAIGLALHVEGVTWTKLLGAISLAMLQLGLYRLARELLGIRPLAALIPCAFLALNSYVVLWSGLGLETPAFLALMVWTPIALNRVVPRDASHASKRSRSVAIAIAISVALAMARPEAPVVVALAFVGAAVSPRRFTRDELRGRALALATVAIPAVAACATLLLARRVYFGHWVAHTFFAKAAGTHFDLDKLAPLAGQGAPGIETLFIVGGIVLLVATAIARRAPAPLLFTLACLYFTASVEKDWMPSLRHLLPVTVLAPLGWAWGADALSRRGRPDWLRKAAPQAALVLAVGTGVAIARIDARYVKEPIDGRWIVPKSREAYKDTLCSVRRQEPPHITTMGEHDMGMITQNYRLIEASAEPLETSWYVGRDIGKVAWYTDALVFDTVGLFTPDVVREPVWVEKRTVTRAQVAAAMSRKPVAGELYDGWDTTLAANPDLSIGTRVAAGGNVFVANVPRPSPDEILARYERSLAKFPSLFYLETLYGESVGAAFAKRTRIVREYVAGLRTGLPDPPAGAIGAGTRLSAPDGGAFEVRGCALDNADVRRGSSIELRCWLRVVRPTTRDWYVFVHFVGASENDLVFQADHPPVGGFSPPSSWHAGDDVRDSVRGTVPATIEAGEYHVRWGLYDGDTRVRVTPTWASDGNNRVLGPKLTVRR